MPRVLRTVGPGAGEEVTTDIDDEFVRITRNDNKVVAFMKNSFITLNVTWYTRHFGEWVVISVCMPRAICEQYNVGGHLGNCDNITANDQSVGRQRKFFSCRTAPIKIMIVSSLR